MARRGRGASRAAAAAAAAARRIRTPVPVQSDDDSDMEDVPEQSAPGSADEQELDQDQDQDQDQEIDDGAEGATPTGDSDQIDENSNPPTPRTSQSVAPARRGRRPGRGGARARPPDWDTPEPAGDDGSEAGGTPRRRGRGRGGWRGGFRGRARWATKATVQQTRQTVDKDGTQVDIVDDEAVLPEDPEGETKVDKDGNLLGGRDYRVRVFTIAGRGKRLYMLSTEPARCTGFRDSYLFFNKHLNLVKIIIDDYEKRDLIDRDIIPHSYKGRLIGVVTARSVFREFGARIVIGGKKVVDDYQVQTVKLRGDVEGEPADPYDRIPGAGETYNKNQYVAWHGASSVYHTNLPAAPVVNGKPVYGKRKATITSANWMFEHARSASAFNAQLAAERKKTMEGVYDAQTNNMFYPGITQPTHARWEPVSPPPSASQQGSPSRKRKFESVDGDFEPAASTNTDHEIPQQATSTLVNGDQATTATEQQSNRLTSPSLTTIFPPLSALVTRNFLVVDTHFQTPPRASLPIPGPNPYLTNSLTLPDLDAEDLAELPEDCRVAFVEAKRAEGGWRGLWGDERRDGMRGVLRIGVGV